MKKMTNYKATNRKAYFNQIMTIIKDYDLHYVYY